MLRFCGLGLGATRKGNVEVSCMALKANVGHHGGKSLCTLIVRTVGWQVQGSIAKLKQLEQNWDWVVLLLCSSSSSSIVAHQV
jgi:hypothetical protein